MSMSMHENEYEQVMFIQHGYVINYALLHVHMMNMHMNM